MRYILGGSMHNAIHSHAKSTKQLCCELWMIQLLEWTNASLPLMLMAIKCKREREILLVWGDVLTCDVIMTQSLSWLHIHLFSHNNALSLPSKVAYNSTSNTSCRVRDPYTPSSYDREGGGEENANDDDSDIRGNGQLRSVLVTWAMLCPGVDCIQSLPRPRQGFLFAAVHSRHSPLVFLFI